MGTGITKRYWFNSIEKSDLDTLIKNDYPNIMDIEMKVVIRNKTDDYTLDKDEIIKSVAKMIGYTFNIDKFNRDNFGERLISVKDRNHPDIKELNGWCFSKIARALGVNFRREKWYFYGDKLQKYWCNRNVNLNDKTTMLFLYICLLMEPYMSGKCKEYFDYLDMNRDRLTFNLVLSTYQALAYDPQTATFTFDSLIVGTIQTSITNDGLEAERKQKLDEKARIEEERRKKQEEDERRYREYKEAERQRIEDEKRKKEEEKRKKDRELEKIAKKLKRLHI